MDFTLRSVLEKNKQYYIADNGTTLNSLWDEEGSAWAIQDYYGSKGSLLDFTDDDWAAAAEHGWSREEIQDLCREY